MQLTYFMRRMQFSGYDQRTRYRVLTRAFEKHEKKMKEGDQPRNTEGRRHDRVIVSSRRRRKHDWYKRNGKYETVMMIDSTPGGILKRKIQ